MEAAFALADLKGMDCRARGGPAVPEQASAAFGFGTPFAEQIDFLRAKLRLPTERWDDIQRSAHDRAFIVAGAAKADLLTDLHESLLTRPCTGPAAWTQLAQGLPQAIVKRRTAGQAGRARAAKGGEAWRTRVIYQTNMSTSYAAGRYKQLTEPGLAGELHPYWQLHPQRQRDAPAPLAPGLARPDAFGQRRVLEEPTSRPTAGAASCRVTAVSKREGEASAPRRPGPCRLRGLGCDRQQDRAPVGIDKGFDYAPGASVNKPLQEFIDAKLLNLRCADRGADVGGAQARAAAMERTSEFGVGPDMVERMARREPPRGETLLAQCCRAGRRVAGVDLMTHRGVAARLRSRCWLRDDHELAHALRATKQERAAIIPC
jgi:hypothetical protein